ncbi:hypothetical protein JOS77_14030 [Chromobacterium haemolyticum]|nr:hypothetical protein JOS77_14030 [Chromobacterium haemolyticum]
MSLGEQIKDSKRAVELAEQAANQLNRSQDAEIEEQQKLQQKQQADAKATEQQAVDAQKQIDTLTQKLSELVGKETRLKVDTDIEAGKTKIAEIQAKLDALKDKTVTVTVAQAGTAALPAAAAGDIQKKTPPAATSGGRAPAPRTAFCPGCPTANSYSDRRRCRTTAWTCCTRSIRCAFRNSHRVDWRAACRHCRTCVR